MDESSRLYGDTSKSLEGNWKQLVLGIEKIEQKTYNLRCRIDAKVIVTGQSGTRYEFSGAGAVVEVTEADVSGLLAKTLGKRLCCGNLAAGDNAFFELVT